MFFFKKNICIFGAGGFAKEVFYLAKDCGYNVKYFVDSIPQVKSILNIPVITENQFDPNKYDVVIAIGSPHIRKRVVDNLKLRGAKFVSLIHPSAKIMGLSSKNLDNKIGEGAVISANCIITSNVNVGDFCQLNLSTTIGHDTNVGNFFTTAPGVHISGNNDIGNGVYFGTNASSIEKLTITDNVIIGAGACVVKNIIDSGTYIGTPAKKIR
jgi:sugar O-acyltransferase (sialic acid O-acetyltransferase NeuD family)